MAFSIVNFRKSLHNLINKNNTTTSSYDISNGLSERVKTIKQTRSENPEPNILYPSIYIEIKSKSENFEHIGRTNKRQIDLSADIVCVTDYGLGMYDGREKAEKEMFKLSENVEKLFRNFPKLSQTTIVMSAITNTDYSIIESNDTYNVASRISVDCKIYSN